MRTLPIALLLVVIFATQALAQGPVIRHSDYQLDALPFNSYTTPLPFRLRGVVLNNTEDWLNPTENYNDTTPFFTGGEAEIMVQAVDLDGTPYDPYADSGQSGANDPLHGDFGGTFAWVGQNYGNLPLHTPGDNYINQSMAGPGETRTVWYDELDRLGFWHPGSTLSNSQLVRAGDLVEIRAVWNGLEYQGKHNVNERHEIDPSYNYEVEILQKGYGLPAPAELTLSDFKNASNQFLYDATRQTGPEHYQSTLVELQNVVFSGLTAGATLSSATNLTVKDETGRTLPVYLGLDASFGTFTLPAGPLTIIGVVNQKDPARTGGYYLIVTDASAIQPSPTGGDCDGDGDVDGSDFLVWQRGLGTVVSPAGSGADRDFSGVVDSGDLALWQATYGGSSLPTMLAVPEPASLSGLLGAVLLAFVARHRRK